MTLGPEKVAEIVDNLDVVVFPQANPDGRHYSMTADPMWRKNRRPVQHGDSHCAPGGGNGPGVDINRNYDMAGVVIITGASSGIGAATARRLGADGWHVVAAARRADRLRDLVADIRAAGGSASAAAVDVTVRDEVVELVDAVVVEHGSVDAFVANAGVMPLSRLDAGLVDEWDRMIDVNIRGLLHDPRRPAALPTPRSRTSGHRRVDRCARGEPDGRRVLRHQVRRVGDHRGPAAGERLGHPGDHGVAGCDRVRTGRHHHRPRCGRTRADLRRAAVPPSAIGDAIAYVLSQPAEVDVNEIVVRPAQQR